MSSCFEYTEDNRGCTNRPGSDDDHTDDLRDEQACREAVDRNEGKRKHTDDKGGTMRLGAYDAVLAEGSRVAGIYGTTAIDERHRHRYEVDVKYREKLEQAGLVFAGMSPDGRLPEIVEWRDHPWFIGVQFHPELKSKPFAPHPLFADFVRAAVENSRLV